MSEMPPTPETMNCPSCGAPVPSDATSCTHCGSRLAVVACPSCFGMVFAGSKFCSHCGAAIAREEVEADKTEMCPRCQLAMESIVLGTTHLHECPKCEGIWADTESLQKICADREQQAAVLGTASSLPANNNPLETVRYIPCPICNKLMNRVAFAHCSGVVVDVCKAHGTWFDKDELRRIVEFIRAGGLDVARADEIAELERKRQELKATQMAGAMDAQMEPRYGYHDRHNGIATAAANLITNFFFD
jgi:Zn-finger nucleic acid-binding protein